MDSSEIDITMKVLIFIAMFIAAFCIAEVILGGIR